MSADFQKTVIKVSVISIVINAVLTIFKILAGVFGNSAALISDAVHSASDVFSTIIVLIGISIASKKADKNHPFGHERYECVAAILLAVTLFAVGVGIGYSGLSDIISGRYKQFEAPKVIALVAAAVSIVAKEGMFWYTYIPAKRINSSALKADAWHHRSDALSSIGSLVGVIGGMCGVKIMDSIASLVICLLILKAVIEIFLDAVKKMTDEACDEDTQKQLLEFISSCEGVKRVDRLMTRLFGNRIFVIVEIACERTLPLYSAHSIAESVHKGIEQNFPLVKHITVHVNPYNSQHPEEMEDENESPL